jgi:site-specific recombinase XerD
MDVCLETPGTDYRYAIVSRQMNWRIKKPTVRVSLLSAGANLAVKSAGIRVLASLAGHSNMATTQRYIDLRPAMLKAAVELV